MRCEDCLPLIEEYFDGEVTGQTAASVRAHLSTCADCSAALDALSFEQEIYARYDRGGLEVTPDLWARVSAEIARTPQTPESLAPRRHFLSRARDYFAATLGALTVRPALASSLALLLVAAAVGTLWFSRRTQPGAPNQTAALKTPSPTVSVNPQPNDDGGRGKSETGENPFGKHEDGPARVVHEPRTVEMASNVNPARRAGGATIDVVGLLNSSPAPDDDDIVNFPQDETAPDDDTDALLLNAAAPRREVATTNARFLEPEQKDVARHVERAQMLLRTIKNVRASEAGDADISYEKSLSRKLLAENATLQMEAEFKGDKETKQVLDRIEPFLLDIANMGDKPSREEVRSIGERLRQNEIVAALEVY